jgi:hypothetical protein
MMVVAESAPQGAFFLLAFFLHGRKDYLRSSLEKFHPVWRAFITDKSSFIASLAGRVLHRLHFMPRYCI